MNYRINSSDIPNHEARIRRYRRRCKSEVPIDEYVNSMGDSKYDATVIETLFNIKGTKCAICLDVLNQPTITMCKHIFCNECIRRSVRHKPECPCCREAITFESLSILGQPKNEKEFSVRQNATTTSFVTACELHGHLKEVKEWIESGKVTNVNMKGSRSNGWEGYTGLMMAARFENLDVVKYLLSQTTIDVSIADDTVGWNALHCACYNNKKSLEILALLLDHPTCTEKVINATDNVGRTPLDKAFYNNKSDLKSDIIKLMKAHGALQRNELERGGTYHYHKTNTSRYILHIIKD